MQRFTGFIVASFFLLLLWSPNCSAVGFGVFLDASGGGSGEMEVNDEFTLDNDAQTGAIGFVLDTAPTNERVFNYRLNVGLAKQEFDVEFNPKTKSKGIYVENIFGFALAKNESFRWWAGPLVRLGYYVGDLNDEDLDYGEFGIGAVTGVNFKVGNAVLSPSIGVRYSGFSGEFDDFPRDEFEGHTSNIFANFAVLF